jgi:alkyl hydroperoxide reductase subunit AhpF
MQIISDADQEFIRGHFAEKLAGPVTLHLRTRPRSRVFVPGREECQYCEETKQLLEEVTSLSPQITLEVEDVPEGELVPVIEYRGANKGTLRFFGIPAGNEFRNLIDTIVEVGSGDGNLAPETKEALASLDRDVAIKVFVTPT